MTFGSSVLLPWLVKSPSSSGPGKRRSNPSQTRQFTPRPPAVLSPFVDALEPTLNFLADSKPDLLTAWQYSHIIFAAAMCLAPFVRSLHMATVLVSLCGIPWALACWAPFAFMGIEINRLTAPNTILANGSSYRRLSTSDGPDVFTPPSSPTMLRLNHLDRDLDDEESGGSTGETAGVYLGILNLFTTLPQFVGTFISMIVFSILEPGKSPELHEDGTADDLQKAKDGPNAIAICLFIGAISAVGAAYATMKMKKLGKY